MSMPDSNKRAASNHPLRVYAPSRGNLAIQEAVPATRVAEPARRPNPAVRPDRRPVEEQRPRSLVQLWRDYKVGPKLAIFCCVFAVAGALLFTVRRYSRISAVQSDINELKAQIEQMEITLDSIDVEYMSGVNINAAHSAAEQAGMVYPRSGNYGG